MRRWLRGAALAALLIVSPLLASADSGFAFVSAASTNCQVLATGSHLLTGLSVGNTGTAAWVKFYDMATSPSAGQLQGQTPGGAPFPFPVPGNAALAGSNVLPSGPLLFTTGIAFCVTGGVANNDTTAVTLGQVAGTFFYQ